MQMLNDVKQYIIMAGIILIVLIGIIAAIGVYFMKFYRAKITEKEVNYDSFDRKDAVDFMKFDDIKMNMIVMGNRFVAGIRCIGLDLYHAEEEEQLQIMRGYLSFFNLVDHDSIQFRQTAESVNLDDMIKDYQIELKRIREEQYIRVLDYEELKKESEKAENYDDYYHKLKKMQQEITSYECQMKQLDAQIRYMWSMSGEQGEPERKNCYLFDWSYNSLEFTKDLSKDEIYEKANRQLENKANSFISALLHAGVKAHRMTGTELAEEIRQFTHPLSFEVLKQSDITNSSYQSVIVTSDSLEELENKVHSSTLDEVLKELNTLT